MSKTEEAGADICCANCGIAGVDDIKLEECPECHSARYCGNKCREEHRDEHEEECKRQKDELCDRKLFRHPERNHRGDCPICFLPLSLENENSSFHSCCSKIVCNGCSYANRKKGGGVYRCPFCRELAPSDEEVKNKTMERVKANDPAALCHMGLTCYNEGDNDTALKYLTKAAELEDIEAHYQLGVMYEYSRGVEEDMEKAVYHYEKAAIGGHPRARHNLGCLEEENGNADRAVKHFIIAANIGYPSSMKALWEHFKDGNITKKDLETTLRSHHDALNGMKSEQREAAEAQKKRLQS